MTFRSRLRWSSAALVALVVLSAPGLAADAASYTVKLAPTGNGALDQALAASSTLLTLKDSAPVGGFALISRGQGDLDRLKTALESQGFYDGHVSISIAGHDVGDATLPATLDQAPAGKPVPVEVSVVTGPQFRLRTVAIDGTVPDDVRAKLPPLASGAPAIAADILAAQARLLDQLREDSYALATVSDPIATEDPTGHTLDVHFKAVAGPPLKIGPITLTGLVDVDPAYVRRRLMIREGRTFRPSTVEAARQDLVATGLFSSVGASLGSKPNAQGELPLEFKFVERKKHLVGFTAAYSTDLGGSLGVTWTDRNVLGAGQQLSLHANATGLGSTDGNPPGYDVGAEWLIPDFNRRNQSLAFDLDDVREFLDAYDRTGITASATLKRKLSRQWDLSIGLGSTTEDISQEGVTTAYELITTPVALSFDNTDSALSPTRGIRSVLSLTPTYSFGPTDVPYVVAQAKGSTYIDFSDLGMGRKPGQTVLALRGLVGTANGASLGDLPPDGRFYGGGSATVRGYQYQSLGPRFADGKPIGGLAIDAATVELRQHVYGDFGAVAFIDAGQVSSDEIPFVGTVHYGAGLGVRYTTSIGPIRLDVATPLNPQSGDSPVEVYIGIGEAF